MGDWREDRIGAARRGENPTVLAKMRSGYAVIGDTQFLPGYCVLLSDIDDAEHLSDLPLEERTQFLTDMALLGEAVFNACNGDDPHFRRINYEILGNTDHYLHAHVFPRYAWEPPEMRSGPVRRYTRDRWTHPEWQLCSDHDGLRKAITRELERLMAVAYALPTSTSALS
ncbi:DeoR family transcriptional regulator [Longispora fulva]|nr:DeoR family transcriptional regulator [Longispora fulva]